MPRCGAPRLSRLLLSFLVPLGVALYFFTWTAKLPNAFDWPQATVKWHPSKWKNRSTSFLFWMKDFSSADSLFAMDLADEIAALGYRVILESPVDGLGEHPRLTTRVNPFLKKILSGEKIDLWDVLHGELPQFILCFSSLWSSFLFEVPAWKHLDIRWLWYFYKPLQCKGLQDRVDKSCFFVKGTVQN